MKKLLSILLCVVMCVTFLAACGNDPAKEATKALTDTLDIIKSGDAKKLAEVGFTDEELPEEDLVIIKAFFGNLKYTVKDAVAVDENTVNVTVEITNVDMGTVFTEYFTQAMAKYMEDESWEDDGSLLNSVIADTDETITKTATVKLLKTNGTWDFDADENYDFADAITGGLNSFAENFEE
ncbi:MAG: hypothetical protein IJA60_04405 [Clostridia bacterium]|nr:hypothetical protein [Clostridia bacterium]